MCSPYSEDLSGWRPSDLRVPLPLTWAQGIIALPEEKCLSHPRTVNWSTWTPKFRYGFWRQVQWRPPANIRCDPKLLRPNKLQSMIFTARAQNWLKHCSKGDSRADTWDVWGLGLSGMAQLSSSPSFLLRNTHSRNADSAASVDVYHHPPKKSLYTPSAPFHEDNHSESKLISVIFKGAQFVVLYSYSHSHMLFAYPRLTRDEFYHLALPRKQSWTGILWCQSTYNAEVTRRFLVKNSKLCFIKSTNKNSQENKLSTCSIMTQ